MITVTQIKEAVQSAIQDWATRNAEQARGKAVVFVVGIVIPQDEIEVPSPEPVFEDRGGIPADIWKKIFSLPLISIKPRGGNVPVYKNSMMALYEAGGQLSRKDFGPVGAFQSEFKKAGIPYELRTPDGGRVKRHCDHVTLFKI